MTKVIFAPSKFVRISERDCPCSQITHESARIANLLHITEFGDMIPKKGQ